MEFLHSSSARSFRSRSNLFRIEFDLQSKLREVNRILCRLYLRQTVGKHLISLVPTCTSLTSGRALRSCKKNAFNSMCTVLRVDRSRLIIPSAAEESQHRICCAAFLCISSLLPNCRSQYHCCRRLVLSQAPESAATNSASPLLSAIVDCFRLDALVGYQPSFPHSHDAVPLTSLAQSESPYVNTEPTGALFTASRLSVVGRTVIIPGFPRRYHRTDLLFFMSVSLARPRLDEAFTIAQRRSTLSIHSNFPTSCRYTFCSLAGSF